MYISHQNPHTEVELDVYKRQEQRKVLIIVENLPVPFDTRVWQEATTLVENGCLLYTSPVFFSKFIHLFHELGCAPPVYSKVSVIYI